MPETSPRWDLDRLVRVGLKVGAAAAILLLLREVADILLPFAVAAALAYLLNPLVTLIERRLGSRTAAAVLTVAAVIVVATSLLAALVPVIAHEISGFQNTVTQLRDGSSAVARRLSHASTQPASPRVAWLLDTARQFLTSDDLKQLASRASRIALPAAWGVVSGAVSLVLAITGLVIVVIYTTFLLIDYRYFARRWKHYLPPDYREPIVDFWLEFEQAMRRYFRGQFIVATINAALFAIGFHLIGLPLALVMALLTGACTMVPYLQAVAFVPAALLAVVGALEGHTSVATALLMLAAVFGVNQLVSDMILAPRILGQSVGLRPVVIMLSVFIWGRLLGFLGLVLAIPLTCLALAYYRRFVLKQSAEAMDAGTGDAKP